MRILVTGASGNIGTALLRRLAGERELVGVSRRRPPIVPPYAFAQWHQVDLGAASAADALATAMAGCDAVVHLAWAIHQPRRDREQQRQVNQGGAAAVLDAARRSGVPHVVCVSSVGAYSPGRGQWVDESWPTGGIASSSYSVDKAAVERLLDGAEGDRTITRVRPAIVLHESAAGEVARYFLGPLAPLTRLVRPAMLRLAPLPRELGIQVVHADDVADAIVRILDERPGGAFNVTAEPVLDRDTLRETFGGIGPPVPPAAIRTLMAAAYAARLQPSEPGWFDLAMSVPRMRTDRLRGLGWAPRRSAIDALRDFLPALAEGRGMPGPLLRPRGGHER